MVQRTAGHQPESAGAEKIIINKGQGFGIEKTGSDFVRRAVLVNLK